MAERFAAEGMRVVLADVEEKALADAEAGVREAGASTLVVRTDVSKSDEVEALARKTLDAFGAVHVVCNNAGVAAEFRPVWEHSLESWQWLLGVNLWGVIHGIRTFVPIMLEQGEEGHVVNTASAAGVFSLPVASIYHATKQAVVTLTESLHFELELADSCVRASVVCPGFVRTAIMESDRNRPPELRTSEGEVSELGQAVWQVYSQACAGGLDPAQVAGQVLDAIREQRFWVFTHPETLDLFRARSDSILASRNPGLGDLGPLAVIYGGKM
jgi:NAD(P)-dependent dehydrogenase (short-subunit alcohol dehydrogenase family)